jgi:predicted RNA-binding protein with PIN domain
LAYAAIGIEQQRTGTRSRVPRPRGLPAAGGAVTGDAGDGPAEQQPNTEDVALPESAWQRLIPLAAATLSTIRPDDLPGPLRRFARFAPSRRAKLAAAALRTELAHDAAFRQRVAEAARTTDEELAGAVAAGEVPRSREVSEVAAMAYVLRPPGWRQLVDAARRDEAEREAAHAVTSRIADAEQRAASAEHERAIAERDAEKLRVELTQVRAEAEELRRRHHGLTKELRELKRRERKVSDALSSEKGRLKQADENHRLETRRLKSQLDESLKALERARRGARDTRALNESRLWLLLETIGGAAQGLRRELALEPAEWAPADFIAEHDAVRPGQAVPDRARGLDADDPIRLDQLLGLPQAHMIVDGYNVTIGGYGELPLEQQRARLIRGLSGIAAQSGAEITVVFDGAERMVGLPPAPRGVRVLFSRKGQTADEVIRALVRAEPNGRPIVVISSDNEVADGTRRHGAYPLSSDTLLKRLDRA